MRKKLAKLNLSLWQWLAVILFPIGIAAVASYLSAQYFVEDKVKGVGAIYVSHIDTLVSHANEISHYALALKDSECQELYNYMLFQPYFRSALIYDSQHVYCSSKTGDIDTPLSIVSATENLEISNQFIITGTPFMPEVPAIVSSKWDPKSKHGAAVIIEGQYLLDSFVQPDVFPSAVINVALSINGKTIPESLEFIKNEVMTLDSEDHRFSVLLEMSPAFFRHFFWIFFAISLPFSIILITGSILFVLYSRLSRHSLADDIRSGIENEEFFLVYQPVICTEDGKAKGVEALVRWQHPQMGLVRPDLFIPIAEESKLIVPLTNYIFEKALKDFANMKVESGFRVAFNVAPEHFTQNDIESKFIHLRDSLDRIGVKPLIEITERQLLTPDICQRIESLRQLGILVAIDDFGTGQTTLSLLQTMPLDYLKIDKCFIDTIGQDSVTSHVLDTIIELSHKMNYVVVAEGVETQEQADYLTSRQVHFLQGYLFAKPMKLGDLKLWLVEHFKK
ncbi:MULTISPECIES: EAL domain-containing protein [unclassified Shewanella]|uniref:EAL domain-containing protein n=1 Tax=Shewanella TaxID=22 RepID=UPI0021DAF916|nr:MULTISPECIES: EAL domain-containing protein [unclassified Shewanella]MCU8021853.1 cyclic diguanylate phosphodiesterase [Shewanella sp. SM78]MCU8043258.1 cyclic diguanylate phosphodiesterase [Shewanella sp. SM68]MCU8047632.1 cyclic diguanylate phosphodiesterase [Shewanella sp. SM65]MCU8079041.1 cyclic diguanylate phosphodiesterase [Shewanella sp. SM103]